MDNVRKILICGNPLWRNEQKGWGVLRTESVVSGQSWWGFCLSQHLWAWVQEAETQHPPPEGVIWRALGPLKEMYNLKFESCVLFGEQHWGLGNSLAVQGLGPCALTAEGPGSVPGRGSKSHRLHSIAKQTEDLSPEDSLSDSSEGLLPEVRKVPGHIGVLGTKTR